MIQKVITPVIHGLLAAMVIGLVLALTVAEPGPILWAIMALAGMLGFLSGIIRVRYPRDTDQGRRPKVR